MQPTGTIIIIINFYKLFLFFIILLLFVRDLSDTIAIRWQGNCTK